MINTGKYMPTIYMFVAGIKFLLIATFLALCGCDNASLAVHSYNIGISNVEADEYSEGRIYREFSPSNVADSSKNHLFVPGPLLHVDATKVNKDQWNQLIAKLSLIKDMKICLVLPRDSDSGLIARLTEIGNLKLLDAYWSKFADNDVVSVQKMRGLTNLRVGREVDLTSQGISQLEKLGITVKLPD